MSKLTTYMKYGFVITCYLVLVGCEYFDLAGTFYEKPKDPPAMRKIDDSDKLSVTKETIERYQRELADYIDYLEQYYVSIGFYYHGDTQYPYTRNKQDECRVYDYIFNDIPLPNFHRLRDDNLDNLVNELINRIEALKDLIKENNAYMAQLREHYKSCLLPNTGEVPQNVPPTKVDTPPPIP